MRNRRMKKEDLLRLKTAFFREANIESWAWKNEHYNNPNFLCSMIHDYLPEELEWHLFKRCYSAKYSFPNKQIIGELWAKYGLVRMDGSVPRVVRKHFYWHATVYKEMFDDPEIHGFTDCMNKWEKGIVSKP